MINDVDDFLDIVKISLGTSKTLVSDEEVEFAISQAENELKIKYPIPTGKIQLWALERAKRHVMDMLRIQSAHRFKYKQLSLNDRFNHYDRMITDMDNRFENALNTDPDLWGLSVEGVLGLYIENGFVYDKFGNDVTKTMDMLVGR